MSTRVTYSITCDRCGETDWWSHSEEQARQEARSGGWVRQRETTGRVIDLCRCCAERAEQQNEVEL